MSDHSRAVQAIQALINRYWIRGLIFPRSSEIEQVLRETMPQPDVEQLTVNLCRELYDRFVMGGWCPEDAHAETVLRLHQWLECAGVSTESSVPESPLRERLAELVQQYRDRGETIMELGDVADLLTSGRGVDGARAGHGTGGRGESDSTVGLPPTSPTNFEPAPPKGDVAAPPQESTEEIRKRYDAEMAKLETPITQEDRVWNNGYRQGWLAAQMKAEAPAEPVAPPTAEAIATKLEELRTSYESGNLEWSEAIHLYNVWRRALEQSAPPPEVYRALHSPFDLGSAYSMQGEQASPPSAESPAQSKEPR